MTCPSTHEWELYDFGGFEPSRRAEMDTHRSGCATCQAVLSDIQDLDSALVNYHSTLARVHAQRSTELMDALPPAPSPARGRGRTVLSHPAVRVAAAVVLMIGAGWWWSRSVARERQLAESMVVVEFVLGHAGDTLERMPLGLGGVPLMNGEGEGS